MTSVLVFNPVSGHGHLDSWCLLVVRSLLSRGYDVQVLSPNNSGFRRDLIRHQIIEDSQLQILKWEFTFGEKIRAITMGLYRIMPRVAKASLSRVKIIGRSQRSLGQTEQSEPDVGGVDPLSFIRHLKSSLRNSDRVPDLILNLYMDVYLTSPEAWKAVAKDIDFPVIGFRFVPYRKRREGYLELQDFKGLCLFETEVLSEYQKKFPDKVFNILPDVASDSLPITMSILTQEILKKANGRKIVFCGGSIGHQKNISVWGQVVELANPSTWFFVLIGEQHEHSLTREDLDYLLKIEKRENAFIAAQYIEDETVFNEIISISDVIFAVYRDFPGSSNMLIKAALFSKPILVSEKFEMGRRVRQYGTGFCVEDDDPKAVLRALDKSQLDLIPEKSFEEFKDKYSLDEFANSLDKFIGKIA
jgi:hypothetical protein